MNENVERAKMFLTLVMTLVAHKKLLDEALAEESMDNDKAQKYYHLTMAFLERLQETIESSPELEGALTQTVENLKKILEEDEE